MQKKRKRVKSQGHENEERAMTKIGGKKANRHGQKKGKKRRGLREKK